jgi:cytochrome c nitrite reductase small subunit
MAKNVLKILTPPDMWKIPVIVISGIICGLGLYIIYISKAPSYLSDNPRTCVNCHIMAPQYMTWSHSAHKEEAHCNDCHVPHNNVVNKYFFKAKDGLRHAAVFTMRREPQVIFIKAAGRDVVQDNCLRCHRYIMANPELLALNNEFYNERIGRGCQDCHRESPHGRINSLSSVPNARVPLPDSPVPEWMDRLLVKTRPLN